MVASEKRSYGKVKDTSNYNPIDFPFSYSLEYRSREYMNKLQNEKLQYD